MTATAERSREPRLPPAYRLVALEEVDSTNAEAKRRAEAGAEDGTMIWAERQTGGYGRQGRAWATAPGNLFRSVAAVAMGEAVGIVGPALIEVTYKWPNDVLLNGRKAAGILLESKAAADQSLEWLVIGLGANVSSFPADTRLAATSLHFEGCATSVTAVDLLEAFARHLLSWINIWLEDGFGPVREAWLRHAQGLREQIEVRLPKETLSGSFTDLDEDGSLILTLADGTTRKISAGDVYLPGEG